MNNDENGKGERRGALLGSAMDVYVKSFKYVLLVCVCVYAPLNIIYELFPQSAIITMADIMNQNMDKIVTSSYMMLGVTIVFKPLAAAGLTAICAGCASGGVVNIFGILDNTLIKWHKLAVTALLYYAITGFMSMLLFVPGIYFGVSFAFCMYVVAVTDTWGFGALNVSRTMIRGRWWATALVVAAVWFMRLATSLGLLLLMPGGALAANAALSVCAGTAIEVVCAYFDIVLIMYFLKIFGGYKQGKEGGA